METDSSAGKAPWLRNPRQAKMVAFAPLARAALYSLLDLRPVIAVTTSPIQVRDLALAVLLASFALI